MGTRATRPRRCERLLRRRDQSCWSGKAWNIGEFYGKSYFCSPRGKIFAQASRDKDEVLVADLDLDMIQEVRKVWQFYPTAVRKRMER